MIIMKKKERIELALMRMIVDETARYQERLFLNTFSLCALLVHVGLR